MDIEFSRSITEVLEILKNMNQEYTEKLPQKLVKFLQDNRDTSYMPQFDYTKNLQECNLQKETKALLGIMYLKYWSQGQQKDEYLKILEDNNKKHEAEIKEKYNTDNLFSNTKKSIEENTQMVEYKENIFQKIFNKIKAFFRR